MENKHVLGQPQLNNNYLKKWPTLAYSSLRSRFLMLVAKQPS